jgi:sec-independent protein translocase protein TatB
MMGSMSFSETIFLFVLALVVFGPKKLPEIARQAGKLLAELRRASNEFKSQIETEIAHLEVQNHEVQNRQNQQTILPPAQPPQGAVASLSLNATNAPGKQEATLAAPAAASPVADSTAADSVTSDAASATQPAADPHPDPGPGAETAPASQDSHV